MATVETGAQAVSGEVVVGGPALNNLMEWCVQYAERTDQDDFGAMEQIVARILGGADAETVLREDTPIQGKDLCRLPGKNDKQRLSPPFILHGFTLTATEFEEGWPFYANLDASIGSPPERRVINCGGVAVIAVLRKLVEFGEWPYTVSLSANRTRDGFTALRLSAPVI